MAPDFTPCRHFDEWLYQTSVIIDAVASELHAANISENTAGANEKLAKMVPAVDGIAAEFRTLLGKPARPDMAEE